MAGAPVMPSKISQSKEKTPLRPIPEPPSKSGWFWSELSEKWFKIPELMETERLASLQVAAEEEAESSIRKESQYTVPQFLRRRLHELGVRSKE